MRMYINKNWQFVSEFHDELLQNENWDNAQLVTLPHTVKQTPFHYFDESEYQMLSAYHYALEVPELWKGKSVLLTFEGAAHVAEVYLNGQKVGQHGCGYTAFTMKLNSLNYGHKLIINSNSNKELLFFYQDSCELIVSWGIMC